MTMWWWKNFCVVLLIALLPTLSQANSCESSCELSYPLHTTYDKVGELKACLTGCRISFITQLSYSLWENNESVASKCAKDCDRGYNDKSLSSACRIGCQSQQSQRPQQTHQEEVMTSMLDLAWHRQLFQPFHHLGRYCSHMYNNVVSLVVQEQQDGSTLVLQFQVKPQHHHRVMTSEDKGEQHNVGEPKNLLKHYANLIYQHGRKWLNCVERRSGLPYWSLVGILFLSLFFMFWVCCSSCDERQTHRKKHVFKEPIPAHTDERLLQPLEKPPPYFITAVPTYEETEQAKPLPQKQPLLDID